jgi:NDP-sugar pyrophosphorylase family protein
MYSAHIESNAALTIGTMRANEVNRYGGIEVEDGSKRIIGFSSEKCGIGDTSNAGIYVFSNSEYLHESLSTCGQKFSLETDFLFKYATNTIVNQFETKGDFLDIGVPKDYKKVDNFFKQRSS